MAACEYVGREEHSRQEYLETLRRRWLTTDKPNEILVNEAVIPGATVARNAELQMRVSLDEQKIRPIQRSWAFQVLTPAESPKYFKNVSLRLDCHRENFKITSVNGKIYNHGGHSVNSPHYIELSDEISMKIKDSFTHITYVEISFEASEAGSYCQDVIFGFNEGPAILRQLRVDLVQAEDLARLEAANCYLQYLTEAAVPDVETVERRFTSSYVPKEDPRDEGLRNAYPKPFADSFFLMHSTLKETQLERNNYRQRMHELLYIEEMARRNQIARYNAIVELRLSTTYVVSLDDASTITKYPAPGELFAQLPLSREITEDTKSGRLLLRSCNSLLLSRVDFADEHPVSQSPLFEAHIEDKRNQTVYVRLSELSVKELKLEPDTNVTMRVQFVMNRTPMCEWHRAIDALPDTRLVFPAEQLSPEATHRLNKSLVWSDKWNKTLDGTNQLNEKQKLAVMMMMTPLDLKLPPILLMGPFGTGKTSTIAQALKILLVNDVYSRVILCTHSNSAADLYVKEFFDQWYTQTQNPRLKPLRIYYRGRARNTVSAIVQKYCPMDEKGYFRDPTNEDLADCGLVICTLATSNRLMALEYMPTHIIIDEAAQALECEALTCFALATKQTRIILAGDYMQLAPEVCSDLARDRGMGVSLLERMHLAYSMTHPCRIQLSTNYRAHRDIVRLTSDLFYMGRIEPGTSLPRHPVLHPLTFIACEGQVEQGTSSTGFYNVKEASMIADRVAELRKSWPEEWGPFNSDSIGVLSHYAEQVVHLRSELRKRRLANVSVERVLNVQGKQFTVVFVSIVRNRDCDQHAAAQRLTDYGFLTNPRLLNTAVTRAKCLVVVVGDPVALLTVGSCIPHWKRFLMDADIYNTNPKEIEYYIHMKQKKQMEKQLNPEAKEFVPRRQTPNPMWVEYVPMSISYPVIHCPVSAAGMR